VVPILSRDEEFFLRHVTIRRCAVCGGPLDLRDADVDAGLADVSLNYACGDCGTRVSVHCVLCSVFRVDVALQEVEK